MEIDADKEWRYGNRIISAVSNLVEVQCINSILKLCNVEYPSYIFLWSSNAQEQIGAEVMHIVRSELRDLLEELRGKE